MIPISKIGKLTLFVLLITAFLLSSGCGRSYQSEADYREKRRNEFSAKSVRTVATTDEGEWIEYELQKDQVIRELIRVENGQVKIVKTYLFTSAAQALAWDAQEERKGKPPELRLIDYRTQRRSELNAVSDGWLAIIPNGHLYSWNLPDGSTVVDAVFAVDGGVRYEEKGVFANLTDLEAWVSQSLEIIQRPNFKEYLDKYSQENNATMVWGEGGREWNLLGWQLGDGQYRLTVLYSDMTHLTEGVRTALTRDFPSLQALVEWVAEQKLDKHAVWSPYHQIKRYGYLLLLTIFLIVFFVLFNISRARKSKDVTIRRIAGLDQIDEAVGRATETARPVIMVPGLGGLDGITVQALTIFGSIVRTAARFMTPIRLLNYNPAVYAVAQKIVRDVYLSEGMPEQFDVDSVRFVSDRQFAFAAAVAGIIQRERVAAAFFMGDFYAESMIFAENANMVGSIQVAATTQVTQTPFFIAACDYVLLGDEFYAASAYLGREPILLGSLVGVDWAKITFIGFVAFAAIVHSWQAIQKADIPSLPIETREVYLEKNQEYHDWRSQTFFVRLTKERRD